ncbi:hypothetical protein ACFOKI_07015 [Sphingomonas qilianensis]|uniref:Uncharacterized protein n=1 Tax=Sphingomonas qilianensis TaxID=1736690 RepID=A0ABU9XQP0_9SPHN
MRLFGMAAATALSTLAGGSMAAVGAPPVALGQAAFLPIDDITTPIFAPNGIEGSLSVSVTIQAGDTQRMERLRQKMPELRAALLTSTLEFARLYASGFRPVDAERLDETLSTALQRVDGDAGRVLILAVSARPA